MNTDVQIEMSDEAFMKKYWEVVAACAWKEYRGRGRGAMLMGALDKPDDAIYLPLDMLAEGECVKGIARLVEAYDPHTEVVAIFVHPGDSVTAYRHGFPERGTPPALYERLKMYLSVN